MPTPFRQLLYSPVRIEAKHRNGDMSAGTSFVFRDAASPPDQQLFLVSNKQVIDGAEEGYLYYATEGPDGRPVVGKPFFVRNDMFWMMWHGHPDPKIDVAVMPLSWQLDLISRGGSKAFLRPISLDEVADPATLQGIDVTEPVLFVGFPNGMFDQTHYLPIFRRGYVATPPDIDFNGEPVFLIDASVFPGSSGSPVFTVGESSIGGTPKMKLLGVVAAVYTQPAEGEILWRTRPTTQEPIPLVDQMIDLGIVFKARCIRETITSFWQEQQRK